MNDPSEAGGLNSTQSHQCVRLKNLLTDQKGSEGNKDDVRTRHDG